MKGRLARGAMAATSCVSVASAGAVSGWYGLGLKMLMRPSLEEGASWLHAGGGPSRTLSPKCTGGGSWQAACYMHVFSVPAVAPDVPQGAHAIPAQREGATGHVNDSLKRVVGVLQGGRLKFVVCAWTEISCARRVFSKHWRS
jgi:hypothetical protein